MSVKEFYSDPSATDRAVARNDTSAAGQACVDSLRALGIESDRIYIEDFDLFTHTKLTATLERFIQDAPGIDLPLVAITVVQYARAGTHVADLEATLNELQTHATRMAHFAMRYNVEINLHVYVQQFAAASALSIAEFANTDALDRVGFFFDFDGANAASIANTKRELAVFCSDPIARNPKIRLGNFPFCLLPPDALKVIYRDAVSDLKGHIAAQRSLVKDVKAQSSHYHRPCAACRCRAACYTYTEIGTHPESATFAYPRTAHTVVFAGGSLTREDVPPDEDQVWCGPAEQGDMVAAVLDGFETILIIDGYFYTKFPCTTLEVMVALEQGVNVLGSASIGALRAVELDRYGMIGVGFVYNYLKQQAIKPYHVVAQTYDDRDRALTTPLIEILYFLECAETAGIVNHAQRQALNALADGIHFTFLSYDTFFRRVEADAELVGRVAVSLRAYHEANGADDHFNVKKRDAQRLLAEFNERLARRPVDAVASAMDAARSRYLSALRAKYAQTDDFTLPRTGPCEAAPLSEVSRDRRACSARETCAHAREFLANLDILMADTTRYDPAGSHILSAFFIPFYFLNYSPSSATGNGDVPDEALASAYMELVERLSACCHEIRGRAGDTLERPPFALDKLPQSYNWGVQEDVKDRAIADHGYVSVTDIVSGTSEWIPGFSIMFRYSGTDGFSSGNTPGEAMLYGLYEVIERDTCQIHLLDATCRACLPHLMINPQQVADSRCLHLLAELDDRGCDVALFLLPNLAGLPCVMCHVYDRNRRIQCHGGIAVRSGFSEALYAALHEAVMQYITYFVGTRDDYHAFASVKQARVAYDNAQTLYFGDPPAEVELPQAVSFASIEDELEHVIHRLTSSGTAHILVADLSPRPDCHMKSVKVIVPGLELWFCPDYTPSPSLAERARRTADIVKRSVQ